MPQITFSDAPYGFCNICCSQGQLTRDHVPPKGMLTLSDLEVRSLIDSIGGRRDPNEKPIHPRIIQGGIKFRSLCAGCNSELLGKEYDPSLIEAAQALAAVVRPCVQTSLVLPQSFELEVKPQRIARAVMGHLLAAEPRENMAEPPVDAPFQAAMREYVLDSSLPLPNSLDILVWLYPSRRQVIIIGSAFAIYHNMKSAVVGSFIKFFPFGFWVTCNRSSDYRIPYERLLPNRSIPLDAVTKIRISKISTPPESWPESPSDDGMLFCSDERALTAKQRSKHTRKKGNRR